jgi:hypothetical protein
VPPDVRTFGEELEGCLPCEQKADTAGRKRTGESICGMKYV